MQQKKETILWKKTALITGSYGGLGTCFVNIHAGDGGNLILVGRNYTKGALHVADHTQIPVISVGGYRSAETIERVLNEGNIAAISMSRPLICEPDLPTKWKMGETTKAKCVSCNRCFGGTYGCKVFF